MKRSKKNQEKSESKHNKEQNAEKTEKKSRKKLITVVVIILVIIASPFIFRGWLRVTVFPRIMAFVYANKVGNTLDGELELLQNPLETLGYVNIEKTPAHCQLVAAKRFATEIYCSYRISAYGEVPKDKEAQSTMTENAAHVQNLLRQNGWSGEFTEGSDYASLEELVNNINEGIDYTPDAYYEKSVGKIKCMFDSNTAYSSPKPPAIASHIDCGQTVYMFGKPIL